MTWAAAGLGALAFALSVIEEWLAAKRTLAIAKHQAQRAAWISALWDAILFADVALVVTASWWLVLPIAAGSWCGNYWAVRHRPKTRRRRRKPWKPPQRRHAR